MFDTYFGTNSGVYRLHEGVAEPLGLASERVWAIHAWHDHGALTILAGSYGNGLYRSEDGGGTWSPANTGLTAWLWGYSLRGGCACALSRGDGGIPGLGVQWGAEIRRQRSACSRASVESAGQRGRRGGAGRRGAGPRFGDPRFSGPIRSARSV